MILPMIWVIDDSETVRITVQAALQTAGFQVNTFADGIEALRWAINNQVVPALILVDIMMPRLNGYEVITHLQKHFRHVGRDMPSFIVLSRRDGVLDRLKARLAGASGSLYKPFTPAHLIAMCNTHIRSHPTTAAHHDLHDL